MKITYNQAGTGWNREPKYEVMVMLDNLDEFKELYTWCHANFLDEYWSYDLYECRTKGVAVLDEIIVTNGKDDDDDDAEYAVVVTGFKPARNSHHGFYQAEFMVLGDDRITLFKLRWS